MHARFDAQQRLRRRLGLASRNAAADSSPEPTTEQPG